MTFTHHLSLLLILGHSVCVCLGQTPAAAPPTPTAGPSAALVLPTDNQGLLKGDLPSFYMFVDRTFENEVTTPWEGGAFGYVRGPVRFGQRLVLMHFHEGMDIAPQKRDTLGEPLDEVRSMAPGEVVYVSDVPGASNYGRYIVVRHNWGTGPFYSLYAHLSKALVAAGTPLVAGTPLGIMGHTGSGLDRRRSHLHVELNVILSDRFPAWHDKNFRPSPNHHGLYNGLNLAGLDIGRLFLAQQKNPALTVPEFIKTIEPTWRAVVPRKRTPDLLKNYPWLAGGDVSATSSSWEITMNDSGFPLAIKPSALFVTKPQVVWVKDRGIPHTYYTRGHVTGSGETGTLTANGERYLELLTGDFEAPAPVTAPVPMMKQAAKKR